MKYRWQVVEQTRWASDENTLLHLYRSLIPSKVHYGAVVYGCARKCYIRTLEPLQNQALCLCLGAFRKSPATILHSEVNEMPLNLRCRKLSSQYCVKVSSAVTNRSRSCICYNRFIKLLEEKQIRSVRRWALAPRSPLWNWKNVVTVWMWKTSYGTILTLPKIYSRSYHVCCMAAVAGDWCTNRDWLLKSARVFSLLSPY